MAAQAPVVVNATAAPFDLSKLPEALRRDAQIIDDCSRVGTKTREQIAATADFGEGQIAGPLGPQFSHDEEVKLTIAQRFGATAGIAGGVAVLSALIMVAR